MQKQVIVADYGGPEKENEVRPFLLQMFKDKRILSLPVFVRFPLAYLISSLRWKKSANNYKKIGFSPVKKNISTLCEKLNNLQTEINFSPGYRYIKPFISDVLKLGEYENAFVFPVFPHYSFSTYESIKDVMGNKNRIINPYYNNSDFLDLLKKRIEKQIEKCEGSVGILLTAHSIPVSFVEKGDKYINQVNEQKQLIEKMFSKYPISLGFQSPIGPVEWVGPFLNEAVEKLVSKKCDNIIGVPLSFTVDNSETLFDLDVELKNIVVNENKLNYFRMPCLNADDDFCNFIIEYMKENYEEDSNF